MDIEFIRLIGIVIIVVGFALKLDVLAVVLIAGLATGLVAGMSPVAILETLGESFINNRLMSIFLISLPVIALIEYYGLKEKSADLISRIRNATAGKVLILYTFIRWAAAAMSVRLGGHVQFVRPLILPMAQAAGLKSKNGEPLTEEEDDLIKGLAAAAENYGNFFGQDIFTAASGVVLIQGTLVAAGYDISLASIAQSSIYAGVAMLVLALIQYSYFDYKIRKVLKK